VITEADWQDSLPWVDRASDLEIEEYVSRLPTRPGFDLQVKLKEWRDQGLVLFEGAIDDSLLNAFNQDIDHLIANNGDYQLDVEIPGDRLPISAVAREVLTQPRVKLNHIHTISLAASRLSLSTAVVEFLRHVFGEAPAVLQSLTFVRGSQQPAHMDYPYVRAQTKIAHVAASWLPLEDIHPAAGPLAYYPGSHRSDRCRTFDWGGGSVVMEPDSVRKPMEFSEFLYGEVKRTGIPPVEYCPRRGDALIWHGRLIHEGLPVTDPVRTRRSYVTHYTSLGAYPSSHKKPEAEKVGAGVFENGGYLFDYPWLIPGRRLPSWSEPMKPTPKSALTRWLRQLTQSLRSS
jgi:phytanoyl-CoA hydroxylase